MEKEFLDNEIYKYLKAKNSSEFLYMIEKTYMYCDDILKEIPKEFANYTLHDITHAIRVINYMTQFVRKNLSEYSDLHLALIVLTGLLHDTGMFISDDEKESMKKTIQQTSNVLENEIQSKIQDYVREKHSERVRNIIYDFSIDKKDTKLSSLFVIGKSMSFSEDIRLICQAHTCSCDWIISNIGIDVRMANYKYNPQQIALLLKIGDTLDIDDRRAPTYLAKALSIKGYSYEHWKKHTPIENYDKVFMDNNGDYYVSLYGKSDEPYIYRLIMDDISWLEDLYEKVSKITKEYEKPYRFIINNKICNKIEPIGFEVSSLQFSLDYDNIKNLLMGENIYGEKKVGLRELLQNSIDAIMVMKERQKNDILSLYSPQICVLMDKKNNRVTIYDNGIGMTKEVLEKYFFNIGKSYYTSEEYKKNQYEYAAIGRYGIGFLACFMLSSHITLETQSSGSEAIVIEFEKTSKFVTKRKVNGVLFQEGHGTKIHLDYDEVFGKVFKDEDELITYIKKLLITDGYTLRIIGENYNEIIENKLNKLSSFFISTEDFDLSFKFDKNTWIFEDIKDVIDFYDVPFFMNMEFETSKEEEYINLVAYLRLLDKIEEKLKSENIKRGDPLYLHAFEDYIDSYKDNNLKGLFHRFYTRYNENETVRKTIGRCILNSMYYDEYLHFLKVPYISDARILEAFIKYSGEKGYENALELFTRNINCVYIINEKKPNKQNVVKMINSAVNMYSGNVKYNEFNCIFLPVKNEIPVMKASKDLDMYMVGYETDLLSNNKVKEYITKEAVYMHGIWVMDERIKLPEVTYNVRLNNIIVNIKNNNYTLNIARDRLNTESKDKLYCEVFKQMFMGILNPSIKFDEDPEEIEFDKIQLEYLQTFLKDLGEIKD